MTLLYISETEVEFKAIRASGPGGQNVNKVASAVQLRFDSQNSSLPDQLKQRILELKDRRISVTGIVVITARQFRRQEANKIAAMERLNKIIKKAEEQPKKRKATRPTRASVTKRLESKTKHSRKKQLRSKINPTDD